MKNTKEGSASGNRGGIDGTAGVAGGGEACGGQQRVRGVKVVKWLAVPLGYPELVPTVVYGRRSR